MQHSFPVRGKCGCIDSKWISISFSKGTLPPFIVLYLYSMICHLLAITFIMLDATQISLSLKH